MNAVATKERYWMGNAPQLCNGCDRPIGAVFYDMATQQGPWSFFCLTCALLGPGCGKVGTGYGQKYARQLDGRYKKTEG